MNDLISRQAALDALDWKWAGKAAIDAIKNLPPVLTIDPVRHGKWMAIGNTGLAACECGYVTDRYSIYNYCPHCGAKMDGGEG